MIGLRSNLMCRKHRKSGRLRREREREREREGQGDIAKERKMNEGRA